ncbi:MAG: hypothetical protein PHD72_03405 [Patescibacteria group bacterium]|nr:hypothetical protein [Patescibacteria group bacterium]
MINCKQCNSPTYGCELSSDGLCEDCEEKNKKQLKERKNAETDRQETIAKPPKVKSPNKTMRAIVSVLSIFAKKIIQIIAKSPKKTIQIIIFVLLIFAFTFNHYSFIKPCVKWEKEIAQKIRFTKIAPVETYEVSRCKRYGVFPTSIRLKILQTRRIPADLIFIFIGAGILYFTKDIKCKNSP